MSPPLFPETAAMSDDRPAPRTAAAEMNRLGCKLTGHALIAMGFSLEHESARDGDDAIVALTDQKDPKRRTYAPTRWLERKSTTMRTIVLAAILATILAATARAEPVRLDEARLDAVTAGLDVTYLEPFATVTWRGADMLVMNTTWLGDTGFATSARMASSTLLTGPGRIAHQGMMLSIESVRR